MIVIWYRDFGQRPDKANTIQETAMEASTLPSSFGIQGVSYGRRIDEDTTDGKQFALRVNPPSDSISQDAVDSIATAFEDNWGGSINHVETVKE